MHRFQGLFSCEHQPVRCETILLREELFMSQPPDTHRVEVEGVVRDLPLLEVAPGVRIAFLDCLVDAEFTRAAAHGLARKLAAYQPHVLVTPEAKSIPLTYAIAIELGCEFITLRKTLKPYMTHPVSVTTRSITSAAAQTLYLDGRYVNRIADRRVVLIDDVISTGSTLFAMQEMMDQIGGEVVAQAAIFTEGDAGAWRDIVALGHLPVFLGDAPE